MGNEMLASLSPPAVLALLLALGVARLFLRGKKAVFFVWLSELCAVAMKALALIFLLVRPFVVQTYTLSSSSMEPTLYRGEGIVVSKWIYRTRSPHYGEVVVFLSPEGDHGETIKRVVGLPGDVIEGRPGAVLLASRRGKPMRLSRQDLRARLGLSEDVALILTPEGVWCEGERLSPETLARRLDQPDAFVVIEPGVVIRGGQLLPESYVAEDIAEPFGPITVPSGHLFVLGDNRNHSRDSRIFGALPSNRLLGRAEGVFWPLRNARRVR
jgi:signal peptidase I